MNDLQASFRLLLIAIEPWLNQIVIIGGWAHLLYRRHPAAQELDYSPLMTLDTDIAVPLDLAREPDIRARLRAHGFTEEFSGDDRPPATHYHLSDDASGFYAEFLAPLIGSPLTRKGTRRATTQVAGVASQQLRYIELLLHNPWSIDFESYGFTSKIRIANPVSFIAQKVLIHEKRDREDRAKDILYMHDTLEVFGSRLHELQESWRRIVSPELHRHQVRKLSKAAEVLFRKLSDDIHRAAQIPQQRKISPEAIREACRYGFIQVFG